MTKYHAELLKGSIGEAARQLAETCLTEFDKWAKHEPGQAAVVAGGVYETGRNAAEVALYDVRCLLDDYLAAELAVVLASWGIMEVDQ